MKYKKKINVYGNGLQMRNWIHVDDNNDAVIELIRKGRIGQIYNIGNNIETVNIKIVKNICKILDDVIPRRNGKSYSELISFVSDRPGHDKRYAVNSNKIKRETKWKNKTSISSGLLQTFLWYSKNLNFFKKISRKNITKRFGLKV